jgi:hypothetical protein
MTPVEIQPVQKIRLAECFGDVGARVILEHFRELDQTFGSAGEKIILRIMQGDYPQESRNG